MSEQSGSCSNIAAHSSFPPAFAWSLQQFQVALQLANLCASPHVPALLAVLVERAAPADLVVDDARQLDELCAQLAQLQAADHQIRSAYVIHPPTSFRVMVSHGDLHRMPGYLKLQHDQEVRLVAHTTERWLTARVVYVPESPLHYFEGVIVEVAAGGGRFRQGDRVQFSEDQVEVPKSLKPVGRHRLARRGTRQSRAA